MALSSTFLIVLNSITAVLGLAVVAGSIYLMVDFPDWDDIVDRATLWVSMAGGLMMIIISFLGCWGAIKQKPNFMCIYIFLLMIVLGLQIGGVVLFYYTLGDLQVASTSKIASTVVSESQAGMSNFLLSSYHYCCSGCPTCDPVIDVPPFCTDQNCVEPTYCQDDVVTESCYIKADQSKAPNPPSSFTSTTVCTVFQRFDVVDTDFPLVGNASNGKSCGGGDPAQFKQNAYDFVDSNTAWFIGISGALIGLQVLTFIAAVIVMCSARKSETQLA